MNFEPRNGRIMVEVFGAEDVSPGGIIIPDAAKDEQYDGIVAGVGPGWWEDGEWLLPGVSVGDHVAFPKYSGSDLAIDGKAYRLIYEKEIFGVFTDE